MFRLLSVLVLFVLAGSSAGRGFTTDEILAGADERIEKYRKGDCTIKLITPDDKPIASGLSVQITQTNHAFLFGCNIFRLGRFKTKAQNDAYAKYFTDLFNFATLPFYWWSYEQQQGKPNYVQTEQILRFCKAHNIKTKGHPLAWNWKDPAWLPDDPNKAFALQLGRIRQCVARFKGQIDIWDVVNEATHYDRPQLLQQAPILTEAISKMGVAGYIRACFQAARSANPNAILIINDYRTDPAYADKVISKLVDEKGNPLYDVIGIQSHQHSGAWPVEKIWQVCEYFAQFGKPLHFTETTILSGKLGWQLKRKDPNFKWESTKEGEKRQAEQVARFYTVLFSHPAVEAITWWDFCDGGWQGAPAGLLRRDLTAKPAYHRLKQLIKGKWWTKVKTTTQGSAKAGGKADGKVHFRGFYGQYKVTVHTDKGELTGSFWFDKSTKQPIEVRLIKQEK